MRILPSFVAILILVNIAVAETPNLPTQIVLATHRLEHPKTSGSGFIVRRPNPADEEREQLLLVTAAHAFEKMEGEKTTLVLRRQDSVGQWTASPVELAIRQGDKPLWHKHPKQDVAVIRLQAPQQQAVDAIPLEVLASEEDWKSAAVEPGALVRCVGFPHAAQFKPSPAGFPLTRLGCIASYPLTPFESHATFLVDYNTFEGDSGGPVYFEYSQDGHKHVKILGLVHGQHMLDERYQLVYQQGLIRKRLGLAIVVNSQAILETIESLPSNK
jgi:hypothetical protein